MCGISGICDFTCNMTNRCEQNENIIKAMGNTLKHRGPDDFGIYIGEHIAFAHTRLAVIDIKGGVQPMKKVICGNEYVIVYNGELYNTQELKSDLQKKGYKFSTKSDTEVLLTMYIEYREKCVDYLNGIYSFVIWDSCRKCCIFVRDRFGVKPLFYSIIGNKVVFSSEIKALFKYPNITPKINDYGLCEIFGLGPARGRGCGVFENINEIKPGHMAILDYSGFRQIKYFSLIAKKHKENYEETVKHTKDLLFDSIKRQLVSDVPICTLLSGGLDSSVVSAVSANHLNSQGKKLDTYSFDYNENSKYFKASKFQPDEDRPFVDIMVKHIGSNHNYLICNSKDLYDCLFKSVDAKDLPGMADVDSSMLYFCSKIKQKHTVCLSGECADEIFGGYPWFRDKLSYEIDRFPWSRSLDFRKAVMNKKVLNRLPLDDYVNCQYRKTIDIVHENYAGDFSETRLEQRQREISYLNIAWFMTTLLDRKDRTTMASGLEVRVPFADHRLIEYLYNVPWKYKYHNNEVKALLKDCAKSILPDEVINRKKCPYPKTYNPEYENLLKSQLNRIFENENSPVLELINVDYLRKLMNEKSNYSIPWFGQLMATPQMYAYIIQINYWLEKYKVKF